MVELLKQAQYQPVPVEEQVAILYAGSSGALDTVPLNRVAAFEKGYIAHLRANHPAMLEPLRTAQKWTDDLAKKFDDVCTAFRKEFLA